MEPSNLSDAVAKGRKFKSLQRRYCEVGQVQRITDSLFVIWAFDSANSSKVVVFILNHGQVIEHYDEDFPLPSMLLNGRTAANRPLRVVVGINVDEQKLVIITTYEPDVLQWADNFSRRIV